MQKLDPILEQPKEKIVATYTAVGTGWVLTTDWLSSRFFEQDWAIEAQTLLLWVLVLITAIFLYWLLHRDNQAIIKSEKDKQHAYEKTVNSWVEMLDMRHKETKDHTLRVARMAENFAIVWGIPHEEVESIRQGAILHDIGKLSVPDSILKKTGATHCRRVGDYEKTPRVRQTVPA